MKGINLRIYLTFSFLHLHYVINSMKKLFFIFLLAVIIIPYACTKRYEEDPWTMHFVRMRKRITGEWHMKKILIDGQDFTHLIYTDTVPFYSVYVFSGYRRDLLEGDVILKTLDGKYSTNYKDITFDLTKGEFGHKETIIFQHIGGLQLNIFSYGAINKIWKEGDNPSITYPWRILKLTQKEMHLQTTYDNQTYDLFFEKK